VADTIERKVNMSKKFYMPAFLGLLKEFKHTFLISCPILKGLVIRLITMLVGNELRVILKGFTLKLILCSSVVLKD
jgi:hypothetical protein